MIFAVGQTRINVKMSSKTSLSTNTKSTERVKGKLR